VLIELANEVGLDVSTFISHLNDGSAEKAFQEDLATTRHYDVRGFPTFLFRHSGKELMLRGYQDLRTMQAVIDSLTGGMVQARAPESGPEDVFAFLQRDGRAAPIEVATVFGLSLVASDKILAGLANERRIHRVAAGNGYFWERLTGDLISADGAVAHRANNRRTAGISAQRKRVDGGTMVTDRANSGPDAVAAAFVEAWNRRDPDALVPRGGPQRSCAGIAKTRSAQPRGCCVTVWFARGSTKVPCSTSAPSHSSFWIAT
jgi:thioredoxin family protein